MGNVLNGVLNGIVDFAAAPSIGIFGTLGYFLLILALFLTSFINHFGAIIENIAEGEIQQEYDFIVIGAGSAGSVVASRLSENPNYNVLLLEEGVQALPMSYVPLMAQFIQKSPQDWQFQTEPLSDNGVGDGLIGNRVNFPQGKALGGTSTMNFMLYTRGNRADYDSWAAGGATGWSYADVLPYFLKLEDNHGIGGPYHRTGGPLTVENVTHHTPLAKAYLDAGSELGYPPTDINGEQQLGFMNPQGHTSKGTRWHAARAYLEPVRNRPNLDISMASHVSKIIIDQITKRAVAVQFIRGGRTFVVKAKREIILSAGALQSSKLLMLSGVGPRDQLQKFGIPIIKELPVGKELDDHLTAPAMSFKINKPDTYVMGRVFLNALQNFGSYFISNNGPLTSLGSVEGIGFMRTESADPTNNRPNIEFIISSGSFCSDGGTQLKKIYGIKEEFFNAVYGPYINQDVFNIWVVLLHPKSTGSITLKSANSYDPPIITANYYKDPRDLDTMVEGIQMALKFANTKAMQQYGAQLLRPGIPACSGFEFGSKPWAACYAKSFPGSFWHLTSTTKMGSESDPTTVVNPRLQVHGISGLRVVDCGVMPRVISAHTNTPTIMVAEKASDMIKEDNK